MKKVKKIISVYAVGVFGNLTSASSPITKVNTAGGQVKVIFQQLGYWILLIAMLKDLIAAGIRKDKRAIGETLVFYMLLYGSLFFAPWMFDFIRDVFN